MEKYRENLPDEYDDCEERTLEESEVLICPHCGKPQYTHEPEEISSCMSSTECEHCEKTFWYAVNVTRSYSVFVEASLLEDIEDEEEESESEEL
jgi:hypothetical protein